MDSSPRSPEARPLVPLPPQPSEVPWPTERWPTATLRDVAGDEIARRVAAVSDDLWADTDRYGHTHALLIVVAGQLVTEAYGGALGRLDGPPIPVTATTPLLSWSLAKSMLHAVIGMLVGNGELTLDAPAPVPAWSAPDDPRAGVTLRNLLEMRDGLAFAEDYAGPEGSDVITMLFGEGRDDVAAYASSRPLAHPPDTVFNYSSGSTNILARIVGDHLGGEAAVRAHVRNALFAPLGMRTAEPRFDATGTFVASSYVDAIAQDFARFGLFALRDGVWEGRRLLPEGWMDHGRTLRSVDEQGRGYGAHWWVADDDAGGFWASGFDGQFILCVPAADAVVVRFGRTPEARYPELRVWRDAITAALTSGIT
jgi:CubicO group peptidase (beta-lactamase class C family)